MDRRQFLRYAATATAVGATAIGLNYVLNPNRHDNTVGWADDQPLPFGVADAPAVSHGSSLLLFGGYRRNIEDSMNAVLEFDGHVWSSKSSMPTPRWGSAATVYADEAYVFGGYPNAVAERYRITRDEWTSLGSMPADLQGQGLMVATVGSSIYLFFRRKTFEYDIEKDQYVQRKDAPISRTWATCAVARVESEDRIYLIGGHDSSRSDATSANYYYLPSRDEWSDPQSPAPYSAYGVTRDNPVWMNRIYYGFGHKNPDLFFKELYSYDPVTSEWSRLPTASHERDGVACAIINGVLFVVGGRNVPNNQYGLTYCEALTL